jgi:arylsulfatase A-like enzyme
MDAAHRLASKSLYYEESACVPMLMMYRNGFKGGRVDSKHLVSAGLDILPTFCDYAGVEIPAHAQGLSLRPLAEGKATSWRSYVASEIEWWRMIRSERYKYATYTKDTDAELLFDMQKDPGEMKNLARDPAFSDVLSRHRRMLKEWCAASADTLTDKFVRAG